MFVIKPIVPSNALEFKTVRLSALKDSPTAFGSTFAKESRFTDADWFKRATDWSGDRAVGYLAMDFGAACGIAGAFLSDSDPRRASLVSMWVAPAHRRTGIGRSLIEAIRTWARGRGAHKLHLMVTSNNSAAIEFYRRNGFAMTGIIEPYPNDSALIEYEMSQSILDSCSQ